MLKDGFGQRGRAGSACVACVSHSLGSAEQRAGAGAGEGHGLVLVFQ